MSKIGPTACQNAPVNLHQGASGNLESASWRLQEAPCRRVDDGYQLTRLAPSISRPTSWLAEDDCTGQNWLAHGHLRFPVIRGLLLHTLEQQVSLTFCC